ncbi:hypothetical protein EDC01DRAFT_7911 [Geopyxis carbonaria]|nr:hypothetical protein EDC01DRAFT_7911 [Geopyxis carbonaria]
MAICRARRLSCLVYAVGVWRALNSPCRLLRGRQAGRRDGKLMRRSRSKGGRLGAGGTGDGDDLRCVRRCTPAQTSRRIEDENSRPVAKNLFTTRRRRRSKIQVFRAASTALHLAPPAEPRQAQLVGKQSQQQPHVSSRKSKNNHSDEKKNSASRACARGPVFLPFCFLLQRLLLYHMAVIRCDRTDAMGWARGVAIGLARTEAE